MENRLTKVSKGIMQINNLLQTDTGISKIITTRGCLHITMCIIISINWDFFGQMKYTRNEITIELIMDYIRIKILS